MTFKLKWLVLAGYITLALPAVLFFLGWTKIYIGIVATLILVAGLVWIFQKDFSSERASLRVPIIHLVPIVLMFCVVVALSGTCQIGISDSDIPYRNAIFNDLVAYDWPVRYDTGNALTYYVAFWLLPALFGKLLGMSAAWVALFVFIVFIMTLTWLIVVTVLQFKTPGKLWLTALFIFAWSGVHYLAAAFMSMMRWSLYDYSILTDGLAYMDRYFNGESFNWYYRSNLSVMSQTYNQMIIWLAVAIMFAKRSPRSYMALGVLVLPFSPWGFLGLIPLLLALGVPELVHVAKEHGVLGVLKNVFSIGNVAVAVSICAVFGMYFMASTASGGVSASVITPDQVAEYQAQGLPYTTQTGSFGILSIDRMSLATIFRWVLFSLFEFAFFAIFLFRDNKKNPLFWTMVVVLAVVPFIWAGSVGGRDFCMNASIASIFSMMILMLKHLDKHVIGQPLRLGNLILVVLLLFSVCGNVFVLADKAGCLYHERTIAKINNSYETLGDKTLDGFGNFMTDKPDDTLFFKYLAR